MQWLIDIIKEVIHGQLGFFNRGDAVAKDFSIGNFTADNAWHDLDLSGIIPENAKAVLCRIRLRSTAISSIARFRTKGFVGNDNQAQPGIMVADLMHWYDIIVLPDADRIVEYRMSAGFWVNIDLTIGGWWLR